MPETLEDKLVVGISSRALFDLTDADEVYEQHGLSTYREYQRKHERDTLTPGAAFPLVKGLLAVNDRAGKQLVEVIIFSRNDADTAMRVLRSVEAHGLRITRGVFRGGREPWPLLAPLSCDVFLSTEREQVLKAREHGVAAAMIAPPPALADTVDAGEVRIAFDGDAVLFDDESQRIYDDEGLEAFHAYEAAHADEPLSPGPFRPFLDGLARIGAHFGATSPIRTALVTARGAPAHYRVVNTLRSWGVNVDETYFLGGVDKADALAAFGAHIFFDDQLAHVESAAQKVPAAQVLWEENELPPEEPKSKNVVTPGRGRKTKTKTKTKSETKPKSKTGAKTGAKKSAATRGAARPAAPRARAQSER